MKLVSKKKFNHPVGKMIQLPYAAADVAAHVTIMVLTNGRVELFGFIEDEEASTKLLALGADRLARYHQKRRSLLVGPDGQPITSLAAHA